MFLDPELSDVLTREIVSSRRQGDCQLDNLSERESQVLELLALGYGHKEIAEKLSLSPKTIESYHSRITLKLDLPSRAAIVRYAMENGYLHQHMSGCIRCRQACTPPYRPN